MSCSGWSLFCHHGISIRMRSFVSSFQLLSCGHFVFSALTSFMIRSIISCRSISLLLISSSIALQLSNSLSFSYLSCSIFNFAFGTMLHHELVIRSFVKAYSLTFVTLNYFSVDRDQFTVLFMPRFVGVIQTLSMTLSCDTLSSIWWIYNFWAVTYSDIFNNALYLCGGAMTPIDYFSFHWAVCICFSSSGTIYLVSNSLAQLINDCKTCRLLYLQFQLSFIPIAPYYDAELSGDLSSKLGVYCVLHRAESTHCWLSHMASGGAPEVQPDSDHSPIPTVLFPGSDCRIFFLLLLQSSCHDYLTLTHASFVTCVFMPLVLSWGILVYYLYWWLSLLLLSFLLHCQQTFGLGRPLLVFYESLKLIPRSGRRGITNQAGYEPLLLSYWFTSLVWLITKHNLTCTWNEYQMRLYGSMFYSWSPLIALLLCFLWSHLLRFRRIMKECWLIERLRQLVTSSRSESRPADRVQLRFFVPIECHHGVSKKQCLLFLINNNSTPSILLILGDDLTRSSSHLFVAENFPSIL